MADEKEAPDAGRRLHVTVLLVASRRALDNALEELGFAEDDDRVIEHDGRLAFLTCTHEEDCDDLFALITELSARGDSWELHRPTGAGALVRLLDVIHTYGVAPLAGWKVNFNPQVTFGWTDPPA